MATPVQVNMDGKAYVSRVAYSYRMDGLTFEWDIASIANGSNMSHLGWGKVNGKHVINEGIRKLCLKILN